jgi:hypothetical protein
MKIVSVLNLALATAVFAQQPPETSQVAPSVARLRVYRPPKYQGSFLYPSIYVDGNQVARVGDGRHVTILLTPGSHTIKSDDNGSAFTLDAVAGQEYFAPVEEVQGMMKGKGKVRLVPSEAGELGYNQQRPIEENRVVAPDMVESSSRAAVPIPSAQLAADITGMIGTLESADHPGCELQVVRQVYFPARPGEGRWDVKSCEAVSAYDVKFVPSAKGGSDFRVVKSKSVAVADKITDAAAPPPASSQAGATEGMPDGFVRYEGSKEQFTIGLPKDWATYDQGQMLKAAGMECMGHFEDMIIFYQSSDSTKTLMESPELMAKVDTGEIPSFFLQKQHAEKGMACTGFSEKAEKKAIDSIAKDPGFRGKNAVEQAHAEPVDVGGCRGLRIRAKGQGSSGATVVADAYAASDGVTLFMFSLRNPADHYAKNVDVFQKAISTLKFSASK